MTYFHGGKPGLRAGDLIQPGHDRAHHDGCPYCEARARGEAHQSIDGPAQHDAVYVTTDRLYGKHYASLYGCGTLYRVEPIGDITVSTEDTMPAFHCPSARVLAVLDRGVTLTQSERRRLHRTWTDADVRRDPVHEAQIRITAEAEKRNLAAAHARMKLRTR